MTEEDQKMKGKGGKKEFGKKRIEKGRYGFKEAKTKP